MLANDTSNDVDLIIIAPLFEEGGYSRRLLADALRLLGKHGISAALPDLPGTGDSSVALETVTMADWRAAIARLAEGRHVASLRGGALIDGEAHAAGWWRMAPMDGADVLRGLRRLDSVSGLDIPAEIAGYPLSDDMIAALAEARPADVAPLRLCPMPEGIAPWRRAEPAPDPALSRLIADDIAQWIATCAAR